MTSSVPAALCAEAVFVLLFIALYSALSQLRVYLFASSVISSLRPRLLRVYAISAFKVDRSAAGALI